MGTGTHSDYSQNDPKWSGHLLGFSKVDKIGPYGCMVTAMANVASAQGKQMTPQQVNDALKAHGLFVQLDLVAGYYSLGVITPHSHFVESKRWAPVTVAPPKYFDVRASVDNEIIIEIDAHPEEAGVQSHFCRVIGLANGTKDLEIVDSWDGKRKLLSTYSKRANKSPFQIIVSSGKYRKV